MKRPIPRSVILIGFIVATWSVLSAQAKTFDWFAFGQALNKGPQYALGSADARAIVAKVADQMARMNVPVNTGWGGRMSSSAQYGQQDIGTCTWINDAVQKALHGAGFRKDQIFGVVGVGAGRAKIMSAGLWLNIDHIAPAVVIDKQVLTFDLWHHSYDTGGFAGMASSRWNGRDLSSWCVSVQHYPGFMFSTYGAQPMVDPMHPKTLQEMILEKQFQQRYPQLKPQKADTKASPSFSGSWNDFTDSAGSLRMTQEGSRVTGTYTHQGAHGSISGTLTGRTLRGTWSNNLKLSGSFEFELSDDGRSFSGSYVYDGKTYSWSGKKD